MSGFNATELKDVQTIIANALQEDVGTGDVTTEATISKDASGTARFLAKA